VRRPRRRFTLVEVLVSVSLGLILVGVVAALFQQSSTAGERVNDSLTRALHLDAAWLELRGGAQRAVAVGELADFLRVEQREVELAGAPTRLDLCEWVELDPAGHLDRVRFEVEWNAVQERGLLWRQRQPVEASELPLELRRLASSRPPEAKLLVTGVTALRIQVVTEAGLEEAPLSPPPDWCDRFRCEGTATGVLHDRLTLGAAAAPGVSRSQLLYLSDDRVGPPRFPQGYYWVAGCVGDQLTLSTRVGLAKPVAYRGAYLPAALRIELQAGATKGRVTLRFPGPGENAGLQLAGDQLGVVTPEPHKAEAQ